ncbi:MAG TPA: alanine racemase [Kofleriaceae bacterium]|nr:alanine racemase [Kofleriaceae bacterium]
MSGTWERLRRAIATEPLPCAIVDLTALEQNVDQIAERVRARGKRLRVATKSLRSPALIERVIARGGAAFAGLMTYTAAETAWWAARGARDLLLAYPTVQRADLEHLIDCARRGATAAVVVDSDEHVRVLAEGARAANVALPIVIDVDMSYRPASVLHLGVRRSPLHDVDAVVALAAKIADTKGLRFHGLMGYEAQIAGLVDRDVGWRGPAARWIKRRSRGDVAHTRAAIVEALRARGLAPTVFNGGGSGSLPSSLEEDALTEVTAGSGFLCSHLFDHYAEIHFTPAVYFALQVVRRASKDIVTCHGGGWIASGAVGADRLPVPALPQGLELLGVEGAGEVQTPVRVPAGVSISLGDPIFFRHAKAGELAEHVNEYLLIEGERVIDRAPTYRGMGLCWLG